MNGKINVSMGQLIEFTADGKPFTGGIIESRESSNPLYVECVVECMYTILDNASFSFHQFLKLVDAGGLKVRAEKSHFPSATLT